MINLRSRVPPTNNRGSEEMLALDEEFPRKQSETAKPTLHHLQKVDSYKGKDHQTINCNFSVSLAL